VARKCDRLVIAESVAEAVAAKGEQPEARFISGGTSMFGDVGPAGDSRVPLISVRKAPELAGITATTDGCDIGANTTAAELLHSKDIQRVSPLLVRAARSLATRQIRNRATIGGNISTTRADHTLVPVLLASDASVRVATCAGDQTMAMPDYLQSMRAGQQSVVLVTAVSIKQIGGFTAFTRVGPRNGPCYAVVSTAIVVDPRRQTVRLAIGNAKPMAFRATTAESLAERGIDWEAPYPDPDLCVEFGAEAARECDPVTDVAASSDYRRHAVGVMARRLLEQALQARFEGSRK
jgi:CO/xanthine dehydrogenase FAD-binding subunit